MDADRFRVPRPPTLRQGAMEVKNPGDLDVSDLMELARECTGNIIYVAQKSGNLSGPFVRKLNMAASSLAEICERLAGQRDDEESRRCRANQLRFERLLEIATAERDAFKR